jgi:hypothetical protein
LADGYDTDKRSGYKYQGGEITVASNGTPVVKDGAGEVSFLLNQAPVTVFDPTGAAVPGRQSDAYQLSGGMNVDWDPARRSWIVTQLTAERLQ